MRVQGPEVRPTHTAPPRYRDHVPEESRAESERLTHSLVLAELELNPESLSSTQGRETDPESTWSQHRHLEAQARRTAIRDNMELIRLQKLLRVKNSELAATKAHFTGLQENQEALRSANEALLAQVEDLSNQLKEEAQKVTALETQLEMLSPLQGTLEDFQERVRDLEKERDLLKSDYDKLLESCIHAVQQSPDEVPQKENLPHLEERLASVMSEKQQLQQQLEEERAHNEELKQEMSQLLLAHAQEVNLPQETTTILENQPRDKDPPQSGPVQPLYTDGFSRETEKEEASAQHNLIRRLHDTEAAHAETVLELEKTRDMLILQHRINRDYQVELEGVLLQIERAKQEHEEKQQQMGHLLDLRSTRVRQLEEQLKDVAYGTWAIPFRPEERDASMDVDPDKAPQLRRGENLFELHISGAVLSPEALRMLRDPEPVTFCTYSFYDFETHCTPVVRGVRPCYNFTSQYVVRAEPLFLQYLQGATARLDLHLACAMDYTTLASCWLCFGEALGSGEQVHATAALHGSNGEDYGLLEYWMRLCFPIEQILRLHHQRTKALGYLSAGVPCAMEVQQGLRQQERALDAAWNELRVRIEGCTRLHSHWLGAQPSPYAIYQFFTFPDHDTIIIPSSNNPHFGDLRSFAVRVTPELHHYLLLDSLGVYVFDDEDLASGRYLGKAQIPLLPLAHGRSVTGDFVLTDPAGKSNGSISLSLEWKCPYMPPEEAPQQASLEWKHYQRALQLQIEEEQTMLRSQAPKSSSAVPLPSSRQGKKPRLCLPDPVRHNQKHAQQANRGRGKTQENSMPEGERDATKDAVVEAVQEVTLEEVRGEEEETLAVEEEAMPAGRQASDAESSTLAKAAPEEPDTTSDTTTESDQVVVQQGLPQKVQPSDRVCVEIVSLSLHAESQPVADESIQQLYVEYRFPGVPLEETETPFSLRKPQGSQEVYFHFSKVIRLDPNPASAQRQLLFSMLEAEEPQHNWLQFVVVSEPLPGAGGECEDVGFANLDLREILLRGNILEQELPVVSSFDPDKDIGKLKVSVEAAAALRAVYWAGKRMSSDAWAQAPE
ncbi:X-linked retinitis pigmentosa GTPase regulator-interacting protein 1 isoform X1 [Tiliqua scincoides]|uniref:X-linked retinitis pigmentosa GTPase regulator-interacting protein 1 isoform X1 n=1 Tax=Tiliqua scincoides TaxID=71010 RepID=UPI003462D2BA